MFEKDMAYSLVCIMLLSVLAGIKNDLKEQITE